MSTAPHIVFLNRCFPPETGATGKVLDQLVSRLGKDFLITVLVGRPAACPADRFRYRLFHRETRDGIFVERLGCTGFEHKRMLGRICNYVTYSCLALWRVLTIHPFPSVIVAMTDPPLTCVLGVLASRLRGSHFVYSIQDLHPDMALAANIVQDRWWVKLWALVHTWAMRKADVVTVLGEDMWDRVIEKGLPPERVIVLRHGAEPVELPTSLNPDLKRKIRADYPLVVMYSGNIGFAGAWETILESAKALAGTGIRFVFIGEGTQKATLLELTKGLPHVEFLPYQPPEEFQGVLKAGDLHIVTIKPGLEGLVVPSKVYPLLVAGCPILAIAPESSDVVRLIKRFHCGLQADPRDSQSIKAALLYAREHPQKLAVMGQQSRIAGLEFSNEKMSFEVSKVLGSVMNGTGLGSKANLD